MGDDSTTTATSSTMEGDDEDDPAEVEAERRAGKPFNIHPSIPFVITFVAWLIIVVLMTVVDVGGAYALRVTNPQNQTLPDVMHVWLPVVTNSWWPNGMTIAYVGTVIVGCLFHPRRLFLLRRLFGDWGILLLMRCMTVWPTSLPDPDPSCAGPDPLGNQQWVDGFELITCGDLIFSGHTTAMMVCALTLIEVLPYSARCRGKDPWYVIFVHLFSALYIMVAVGFILAARFHYTIDTWLAIMFSFLVWALVRSYLRESTIKRSRFLTWWEQDRNIGVGLQLADEIRLSKESIQFDSLPTSGSQGPAL